MPYQRLRSEWRSGEAPGPHIVLADAVVPFLEQAHAQGHAEIVQLVLGFAEVALREGDDRVVEAIGQSLLEPMSDRPALWGYAQHQLGPKARSLATGLNS